MGLSITIPQAPYHWQPNDVWEGIDLAHLHHNTCIAKKKSTLIIVTPHINNHAQDIIVNNNFNIELFFLCLCSCNLMFCLYSCIFLCWFLSLMRKELRKRSWREFCFAFLWTISLIRNHNFFHLVRFLNWYHFGFLFVTFWKYLFVFHGSHFFSRKVGKWKWHKILTR